MEFGSAVAAGCSAGMHLGEDKDGKHEAFETGTEKCLLAIGMLRTHWKR